jgi:tyrosyl-tRNA synthetase
MIMGLDGSDKMSKSSPDNTIFMDDNEDDVKRKIQKAFCELGNIDKNPILDWIKWIIIPINGEFKVSDKIYTDFIQLQTDYANKKIHPSEIKKDFIEVINKLLEPIRKHFIDNKTANELLKQVKSYK